MSILVNRLLLILFYSVGNNFALRCIVIRPGQGLVSEHCPGHAVGCRIRVENRAIVWYESNLYDRNAMSCVLHGEFPGHQTETRSGCVRKANGVRCWCHGRDNCNTAENIKQLYKAFMADDPELFQAIANEIASAEPSPDTEFYDGDRRIPSDDDDESTQATPRQRKSRPTLRPWQFTTPAPSESPAWPLGDDSAASSSELDLDSTDREADSQANDDFHKYEVNKVNIVSRNTDPRGYSGRSNIPNSVLLFFLLIFSYTSIEFFMTNLFSSFS